MSAKVRKLAEFVYAHMEEFAVPKRIEFYDLLSEIMPTAHERMNAAKAAYALRESENAQLVFGALLPKPQRRRKGGNGHN